MSATGARLVTLSRWIDEAPANASRDREAALWGRVAKVAEESGEAVAALIAATGQNPRKPATDGLGPVVEELLDVAVAALGAIEHITGHRGDSIDLLAAKVDRVVTRAGLG